MKGEDFIAMCKLLFLMEKLGIIDDWPRCGITAWWVTEDLKSANQALSDAMAKAGEHS